MMAEPKYLASNSILFEYIVRAVIIMMQELYDIPLLWENKQKYFRETNSSIINYVHIEYFHPCIKYRFIRVS